MACLTGETMQHQRKIKNRALQPTLIITGLTGITHSCQELNISMFYYHITIDLGGFQNENQC